MKSCIHYCFLLVVGLFLQSYNTKAQTLDDLGTAANFGVLAGNDANTTTPTYVYGMYGGFASTSATFSGASAAPAGTGGIQSALNDLASCKAKLAAQNGSLISRDLSGISLIAGVYQIDGDAFIKQGGVLQLRGTSKSFFVFNISKGLSLEQGAAIELIGIRPEHIFWNAEADISFEPNTDASGLFLAGGSIITNSTQFGNRQLLAKGDVLLYDLTQAIGTSSFYAASVLAGSLGQGCTNATPSQCDNQVINGDFENYRTCPVAFSNMGYLENNSDVCNFFRAGLGTSDYFNACLNNSVVGVPQNFATTPSLGRTAHSGTAYTGIYCGNNQMPALDYREYIGQELAAPLQSNEKYYAEFWVSQAINSIQSVRQLGIYLSSSQQYFPSYPSSPVISLPIATVSGVPGIFPNTASTDWYKISGIFTAGVRDQFVTIGSFLPYSSNNFGPGLNTSGTTYSLEGSYYFIDDLSITKLPKAGPPVSIISNCAQAVTIGQGCVLPASLGPVTYQWSPTAGLANPNQLITQASPNTTTTYTLTITVGGQSSQSSVTVTVNNSGPIASAVPLGSPNTTTTLTANSGATNFSGSYQIQGDLLLTNGTFTLTPGTTFFFNNAPVNGQPIGKIIIGDNATLRLNNATIRGACNSWYGIVLSEDYANTHLIIENNSTVSNARYGVIAEWHPYTSPFYPTQYTITNSTFENNLTHVYDESHHNSVASSCIITGCTFTSNAQMMLPPYSNTSGSSAGDIITYQALFINPFTYVNNYPNLDTPANSGTVAITGNAINTAVYGILNNRSNRGFVNVSNNTLTNIYTIGIWKAACLGYDVNSNTISLNGSSAVSTTQISPNNPVIGIEAGAFSIAGGRKVGSNTVNGDNAQNQSAYKEQIGIVAPFEPVAVRDNTLNGLSSGVTYNDPYINMFGNRMTNCLVGLKLIPYNQSTSSYIPGMSHVNCNTFESTNGAGATAYGILAPPRIPSTGTNSYDREAYFPDLGTAQDPCGNRFSSIGYPAVNNGNNPNPTYYSVGSIQEYIQPTATLRVTPVNINPANYCQNRGATTGVNRQAPLVLADVQALMDSVRRQQASVKQQRAYLGQIIQYFVGNADLAGLDVYTATLPTDNKEAIYVFNLYLLRAYASQNAFAQAQRARQQLLRLTANDGDLRQEIALLDLLPHADAWPPAGGRLPVADSLGLARIAASGATVAERAAMWLRYYYPHAAPYRELRTMPAPMAKATTPRVSLLQESELYPNPATGAVVVRYRAMKAGQSVGLQVFDLLTSRQVLETQLPTTVSEAAYTEATLDLQNLPAGQYSYRFVVAGKVQTARHLIIQK